MSAIDRDVVRSRLTWLQHHLTRVDARCPRTLEELVSNEDTQDIVAFNLEKAIQFCVDIATHVCAAQGRSAETAAESFEVLSELGLLDAELAGKLKKAVGFRNVSVHEYADIDWAIVFRIASEDIRDLKEFGRAMAALIAEPPAPDVR